MLPAASVHSSIHPFIHPFIRASVGRHKLRFMFLLARSFSLRCLQTFSLCFTPVLHHPWHHHHHHDHYPPNFVSHVLSLCNRLTITLALSFFALHCLLAMFPLPRVSNDLFSDDSTWSRGKAIVHSVSLRLCDCRFPPPLFYAPCSLMLPLLVTLSAGLHYCLPACIATSCLPPHSTVRCSRAVLQPDTDLSASARAVQGGVVVGGRRRAVTPSVHWKARNGGEKHCVG